ncbi:carbamoyl-phosphate synthase large subunit [Candidatus Entotheonella palauensis]|uniref:carbamoyl-phosphate synthase large subunit n=1 Tax=Candidatus Entotheonella palauensis TaxID=93172 RepID=UPI000B7C5C27|nr:carbamoyl-phosphate synthase large subunit [Candidatus Entotheonella palauensis]
MPKRQDIEKILLIGPGPIVIGQACEFDYSGTQACKALKEEGYTVVLVNSNPATIMTDPDMADRTYVEPLTPDMLERILRRERPQAVLPTMGGQTALNLAVSLAESGVLEELGIELIGAKLDAIQKAEDRELFKQVIEEIGLAVPRSGYISNAAEADQVMEKLGLPLIIRPSFTLGGMGGNIAYNIQEFKQFVDWGLAASPRHEVLLEESVLGWKEYELEVMRDLADNVVIICSIENMDAMGVHTGDSITVAPAQTLTDKEYQRMRDAAIRIIRAIGVETGGSNIQFAVRPDTGELIVIEMNPRVSRSSALASKATGFPIAKIAAKLAVGYTLDEIPNDITRETPASFEPTIDYCVVKTPRFAFEKFPEADSTLTTQMKSVGEAMSIGRTFKESLHKAMRSLETGHDGFDTPALPPAGTQEHEEVLLQRLRVPGAERLWYVGEALRRGMSVETVAQVTSIDPWFLVNIQQLVDYEAEIQQYADQSPLENPAFIENVLPKAKQYGFADARIATLLGPGDLSKHEMARKIRDLRQRQNLVAAFKMVDTCGAEFVARTPYFYSTYERDSEAKPEDVKKIMILGGGPNRIGQGIEFDYCCVHAAFALKDDGYQTIMVNCNPETVSTDYDTSDRLYFEPLTFEDVMNIVEVEKPDGAIVQFGGQTPLNLAVPLAEAGVPILGTSPDSIDRAEDRKRFQELLQLLNLRQPPNGIATSLAEARDIAHRVGYPVVVRPSYVLGGRAMEIVYDDGSLEGYMQKAVDVSPDLPILIDKFLEDAIEVDVDAICDGTQVVIGGIMEHIEEAGVHSGDSACSLPPYSLSAATIDAIQTQTRSLALELGVVGLLNIQFAIQQGMVYVLEVNPRASRTVPFVSKTIGVPLAKLAARVMAGKTLAELGFTQEVDIPYHAVKEAILPFIKFPGVDTVLGPEMKSTGEVIGLDVSFGRAFAKSQMSVDSTLPQVGSAFISVRDRDKPAAVRLARDLADLGFHLVATQGTATAIAQAGVSVEPINKVKEGRPHIVDIMTNGKIDLVINTLEGKRSQEDSYQLRRTALTLHIPYCTTMSGAFAAVQGIRSLREGETDVRSLQEYHQRLKNASSID